MKGLCHIIVGSGIQSGNLVHNGVTRGQQDDRRSLMRAQAASGQRVQAMETYRLCAKHLAEELGIDPGDRMREMYCELLNGKEPMQKSAE